MIKVSAINIEKLRNNQFQDELPEFFELKNYVENNSWHNNDSVFNHTLTVLTELEKLLRDINNKINSYLNQKIENYTKRDLLFLGTLFHDIAKSDTFVKTDNSTTCKNHEELGSEKVAKILDRFDLSNQEKAIIIDIVKFHGDIHIILSPNNKNIDEQYQEFKTKRHEIFMELILLAMADTLGSQLKDNNSEDFKFRIDFYKKIINDF
ncbi:HD domain-containing protein [Patescibacteria group bacterium]